MDRTLSDMAATEAAHVPNTMEQADRPVLQSIRDMTYDPEDIGSPEDAEFAEQMAWEYGDLPPVLDLEAGRPISHTEANRIVGRMAEVERSISLIDDQEADEIERIRLRASEIRQAHQKRLEWLRARFEMMLQQFASEMTENQKARSVKLLNGVVGFRKNPGSLKITDTDAALEWARANLPDAVKVVESVEARPVKSYVEGTGEALPFVEYSPPFDKFYIDAAK